VHAINNVVTIVYMFYNNVSYITEEFPYILCTPSACRIYITTVTVVYTIGTPTGCLSCEMSFVYIQSQLIYSQKPIKKRSIFPKGKELDNKFC